MKKTHILICALACLSIFTGCKKEDNPSSPTTNKKTKRTILTYMFQDSNLWDLLAENINDMERGWDPKTDGTMLVYVDPSTSLTQFDGKPVLLEITHDTTNLIVSKIVKVYPDIDATNTEVFVQAQKDAIEMYPADSYGLVLSGHGNGFFVTPPASSKGLSGSDRWSNKGLDIDVIAKNMETHYDFIIFDACLMGESTTLYQLRNVTDFVVASVELSAGEGFGFRTDIKALYTQPKADLYTFAFGTMSYYLNTVKGQLNFNPNNYLTLGVYRMSAMEKLAATTKKVTEELNLTYSALEAEISSILGEPNLTNSMYYPFNKSYSLKEAMYYDMGLLLILLKDKGELVLASDLQKAINNVVMQKHFAFSEKFEQDNASYKELTANLSFYIPTINIENKIQSDAFYNRFGWSAASGFTNKWE